MADETTAPASINDTQPNAFDRALAILTGINDAVHTYQDSHDEAIDKASQPVQSGPTNTQFLVGVAVVAVILYFVFE